MGYPTIDKFDIRFIERTKTNFKKFNGKNSFTNIINSLIGLIFVPNEFNKKGRRTYQVNFFNRNISDYKLLLSIFSGIVDLTDEKGKQFQQKKFFHKDKNNKPQTIHQTSVGNLVGLFRNSIAHQNITPVADGDRWKGIIVKNFRNKKAIEKNDFNFEAYLTQKELKDFALFIADEYLINK